MPFSVVLMVSNKVLGLWVAGWKMRGWLDFAIIPRIKADEMPFGYVDFLIYFMSYLYWKNLDCSNIWPFCIFSAEACPFSTSIGYEMHKAGDIIKQENAVEVALC